LENLLSDHKAQFMLAHICANRGIPVKALSKSSHHEDFCNALTFGSFGEAFLSTCVQKSAILANLLVAKRPLAPQHKKHKTHNNKMSRRCPTPSGFALNLHG
jgi:hypothetical protein